MDEGGALLGSCVMRVTKASVHRACAVCERTLLQGEHALRFSPDGVEFVDVCPLCQEVALDYGWVREGGPMSPVFTPHGRRRRPRWAQFLGVRDGNPEPLVAEPVLRRLSDSEVTGELVLTFAWEITWYQYRVVPDAPQPIRLADRGADISEIEPAFTAWNAKLDESGRVVPDVAR